MRRFTAEDLVASLDSRGPDKAVVCYLASVLVDQDDFKRGNNAVMEATWKNPEPSGASHGQSQAPDIAAVRGCLEAGLKAVKLQPLHGALRPSDSGLVDPMRRCADAGVPLDRTLRLQQSLLHALPGGPLAGGNTPTSR